MIEHILINSYNTIITKCELFTQKKNWILILTLSLPFIVFLLAFPSYEGLKGEFAGSWKAILTQVQDPFLYHEYDPNMHESKLSFRITMPFIAYVFHLEIIGILIVQALFGTLLFYFSIRLFERITQDKVTTVLLTLSLAFIYAGRVSFTEIRGIFDGLALFFLVTSMYFKNPLLIFISVFLASWTDERALIASSLVFLYWMYYNNSAGNRLFYTHTVAVMSAWIAYFATRYILTTFFGFSTNAGGVGLSLLMNQVNNMPMGIWSALEGNWLLVIAALWIGFKKKKYTLVFFFTGGISLLLLIALSVMDITRSMAYLLPALFLAVALIKEVELTAYIRKLVVIAMLASFLYPAYYTADTYYIGWTYPFPIQLLRYAAAGL
ncbi:hypothetical protein [Cytophaga aurantiaca]|uniref:hypothetical protein n=1 Tax=Cytophaga aurantiaca TaxID=29530 RepID=UPI000365A8AE|nr:hypothetical protein [Cytophaga aurantiaca]